MSARFIFPWIIRRFMKRVERRFYEANPDAYKAQQNKEEGEISIVHPSSKTATKKGSGKMGDYVEFEEIKEN
jgi:hypothetical protein